MKDVDILDSSPQLEEEQSFEVEETLEESQRNSFCEQGIKEKALGNF